MTMRNVARSLKFTGLLAVGSLFVMGAILLATGRLTGAFRCETVIADASRSPDGKYALLTTRTNCGATDPFDTQIILVEALPTRDLATKLGKNKIIIFDVDERSSHYHLQAAWKGAKNLLVACQGCKESDVEIKKSSWKDVRISYDIQP